MEKNKSDKKLSKIKRAAYVAFPHSLPIFAGYGFLGLAYGISMSVHGFHPLYTFLMCIFIFGGSTQIVAISLLTSGFDPLNTFAVNLVLCARHIFYGISLIDTYKNTGKKKPYLIFALTDETYSLVTQNQPPEGMKRHTYCFLVSLLDHIYWVAGCVIGSVAGNFIPISFEGIEFVLTALFVTLFTEQWLANKNHFPAIVGVGATVLCLAIFGEDIFLIPSMVLIAIALTTTRKTGKRKEAESNA
jgi:4-azaleucine resistance transporter AzlC